MSQFLHQAFLSPLRLLMKGYDGRAERERERERDRVAGKEKEIEREKQRK